MRFQVTCSAALLFMSSCTPKKSENQVKICYNGQATLSEAAHVSASLKAYVEDASPQLIEKKTQTIQSIPNAVSFPKEFLELGNSYEYELSFSIETESNILTSVSSDNISCEIQVALAIERGVYSKDDLNVYFLHQKLEGADVNTFKLLEIGPEKFNHAYGQDKNGIYCSGELITSSPAKFEKISADFSFYSNGVEVFHGCSSLEGANPQSFEALSPNYSKDSDGVYFKDQRIELDAQTFSIIEPIELEYAKDQSLVVLSGKVIEGATPNGFLPIDNSIYSKDTQSVFYNYEKLAADVQSFSIIHFDKQLGSCHFAKDATAVYHGPHALAGLDPNSTTYLGHVKQHAGWGDSITVCYLEDNSGFWKFERGELGSVDELPSDLGK